MHGTCSMCALFLVYLDSVRCISPPSPPTHCTLYALASLNVRSLNLIPCVVSLMARFPHIDHSRESLVWDHLNMLRREKTVCAKSLLEAFVVKEPLEGTQLTWRPIWSQKEIHERGKRKRRRKLRLGKSQAKVLLRWNFQKWTHVASGGTKYIKESPRTVNDSKLAKFVATTNSFDDKEEFRELLVALDYRYVVPGKINWCQKWTDLSWIEGKGAGMDSCHLRR